MSHTALGRALLWQDPALAIVDPVIGETNLRDWYGRLARKLSADSRAGGLAERLAFPAALAAVLEVKANLRRDLSRALARRDRRTLKRLLETDVAAALRRVETLWKCRRTMWMNTYKPFGWEVLECRLVDCSPVCGRSKVAFRHFWPVMYDRFPSSRPNYSTRGRAGRLTLSTSLMRG